MPMNMKLENVESKWLAEIKTNEKLRGDRFIFDPRGSDIKLYLLVM